MAVCSVKEDFLEEFGQDYGYPNAPRNIDQIRATEFKRLDGQYFLFSFYGAGKSLKWTIKDAAPTKISINYSE